MYCCTLVSAINARVLIERATEFRDTEHDLHLDNVRAAFDRIGPRIGDLGDGSDPYGGARRHNAAFQRHITHDWEWAENPQLAAFAHVYGLTVAVIDGAAPHNLVQTFPPTGRNSNPVGASRLSMHDVAPLLLQGRALLLHWTPSHIHYEPVLPGVTPEWRDGGPCPVVCGTAGNGPGSGSEVGIVGRGHDVRKCAIQIMNEGGRGTMACELRVFG